MNSVVTPAACACATIDATLPALDLLTYQIHMPWPSNGEPLTAPTAAGAGVGVLTDRRVQRVPVDVDRPVRAGVARMAEQHHDAPGARSYWAP